MPRKYRFNPSIRLNPRRWHLPVRNKRCCCIFGGSWCGICKHTSPVIHRLHKNGTPVLAVALRSGTADDVRAFLQQQGLTFDTVNDEHGALSQQWGVKVVPSIILIKNGKVVHGTTGLATYWGLKTRIAIADLLR
ncbi:thioredoxin domain-containing protein [Wielerella bovis]|uniref:thioredoxin domain-containing protein n=1 Tax=Wielerella bovis TaxID=2917790 RepID=UPI002018C1A0|nr:thioredoxin domain-containing protein [Wielerella bovis]ULJ62102.1 thioredoxin domain-containing protein [Wielerella bovis]